MWKGITVGSYLEKLTSITNADSWIKYFECKGNCARNTNLYFTEPFSWKQFCIPGNAWGTSDHLWLHGVCQASLSFTIYQSLLKLMSTELVMPSKHLILCFPLLLLSSIFPSNRVFSNESVLHIRWTKYWSFSFSISPPSEYSGLIFRIDCFHSIPLLPQFWTPLFILYGTSRWSKHLKTCYKDFCFYSSKIIVSYMREINN